VAERVAGLTGAGTVIGCSAGGVIGAGRGLEHTEAVSVWAAVLPGAHIRSFHLEVMRVDDGLAVVGLPERHPDDSACVLLADPFSFPVDTFVEGINDKMPGLPIVGGVASGVHGAGSTRLVLGAGRWTAAPSGSSSAARWPLAPSSVRAAGRSARR
jgi:small ligand-binding sensory domain FIST